jgi:hypothetical protein
MKDFYDIWFMANHWTFEMEPLRKAIEVSFERRGSSLPADIPFALTADFLHDAQKKLQWGAFVSRLDPGERGPTLAEVGEVLRSFLLPCISEESPLVSQRWTPTLRWH